MTLTVSLLLVALVASLAGNIILLSMALQNIPRVSMREAKPTERQLEYARHLGIRPRQGVTRGELSDQITIVEFHMRKARYRKTR